MKINLKQNFKYIDYSNNIFTKITLVNALTQKEFDILNEKYKELGLFIRQVQVDSFGNEIFPNENENIFLNKKRRLKKSRMTIKEFYEKYYFNDKKRKHKKSKIKKNKENKNSSLDSFEKENSEKEDGFYEKTELKKLNENLKDLYRACQNINIKNTKINDENYKKSIINYIIKFSKYLSNKQYEELFSKYKNENYSIIGFNLSDDVNNLNNWKLPILRAFKSEMMLIASTNLLGKQIGEENNMDENINNGDKDDENKKDQEEGEEEKNESESISSNNNYFQAQIRPIKEIDDSFNNE